MQKSMYIGLLLHKPVGISQTYFFFSFLKSSIEMHTYIMYVLQIMK